MAISWRRWTQFEANISKNVSSGDTEPMLEVYVRPRSSFWIVRRQPPRSGTQFVYVRSLRAAHVDS
jgi:hypothetical protein